MLRLPESSMAAVVAQNFSMASATNPLDQAARAASICFTRSPPAALASVSTRLYISAIFTLRNRLPGCGALPSFR